MSSQAPQPPRTSKPRNQRTIWIWWFVWMVLLLIWNVFVFPRPAPRATIPYSTLLAQVRAGNVTSVHLTGDDIAGAFRRPFAPPSATPTSAASPTPSASASPKARVTYSDFDTTFPQVVGDPSFLPLLEAHHVTVDVSTTRTNVLVTLLITWGPMLLLVGAFVWMSARAGRKMGHVSAVGSTAQEALSRALASYRALAPGTTHLVDVHEPSLALSSS